MSIKNFFEMSDFEIPMYIGIIGESIEIRPYLFSSDIGIVKPFSEYFTELMELENEIEKIQFHENGEFSLFVKGKLFN